ncbi:MAG: rubredoxin [Turicibacter sp.]|nr:rubredoxin [Turicibacter sp.]
MKKWVCDLCGYEHDEEASGVKFEDLPEDWVCPLCGAGKEVFREV